MKTFVYFHICCRGDWKNIVSEMFNDFITSGLYDHVYAIRCGVLGNHQDLDEDFFKHSKVEIIGLSTNYSEYEAFTLYKLYDHALQDDFNVLYLHSKVVTKPEHQGVKDWTRLMCFFNIKKFRICNFLLDHEGADVVGVNFTSAGEWWSTHFSGNFWWTKTSYLRTLSKLNYDNYFAPEFWVCSNPKGQFVSLFNSNINHYDQQYGSEHYSHYYG